MEEMLEDTMEGLEDDDMEDEAEEEVDKVLYELTAGNIAGILSYYEFKVHLKGSKKDNSPLTFYLYFSETYSNLIISRKTVSSLPISDYLMYIHRRCHVAFKFSG